jgi:hypothetical protein
VQAEAVKKLRAQLSLLRVAGADEDEARGVLRGHALALDQVAARDRNVKQQVNQVVVEQIHLVYVEEPAVGAREQSRLESLDARGQRALDVDGAADAVFGRPERQLRDRHVRALARQFCARRQQRVAVVAEARVVGGVAVVEAAAHALDLRHEVGERAHRRGLARPAVAHNQHAAD